MGNSEITMQENVRGCTLTLALVMTIKCYATPERSGAAACIVTVSSKEGAAPTRRENEVYTQPCPLGHFKKS